MNAIDYVETALRELTLEQLDELHASHRDEHGTELTYHRVGGTSEATWDSTPVPEAIPLMAVQIVKDWERTPSSLDEARFFVRSYLEVDE